MLLIGWMFIALIFKGHRRSNVSPFYTDNMRLCYSHLLKWSRYNMYRTNAQRPDPFFRCDLDLIICHNLGSLIQLFDGTFNPLAWFCQWSRKFHWNPTRIDRDIAFFMRVHAFGHIRFWNKRILYILYIYIPWNGKEPRVDKQFRRCVLSLERKIGKEEENEGVSSTVADQWQKKHFAKRYFKFGYMEWKEPDDCVNSECDGKKRQLYTYLINRNPPA